MKPLPPDPLPHDAEMTLRKAFRPKATEAEWQAGWVILRRALDILLIAVCANEKVVISHLTKRGVGKVVATVVTRLLKTFC